MAQSLTSTARTSAHIIPLPTAAQQPVQQKRGPGRLPSHIINLCRWKSSRPAVVTVHQAVVPNELEQARQFLATCERLYQDARSQFLVAQQRTAKPALSLLSH